MHTQTDTIAYALKLFFLAYPFLLIWLHYSHIFFCFTLDQTINDLWKWSWWQMSIRIHWTVWYEQCRYEAFILTMLAFYVRLCLVVVINNNLMSIFITRYAVIVITNKCCCRDHIDNDRMLQCNATKNNNRQKLDLADVLWGIVETISKKSLKWKWIQNQ